LRAQVPPHERLRAATHGSIFDFSITDLTAHWNRTVLSPPVCRRAHASQKYIETLNLPKAADALARLAHRLRLGAASKCGRGMCLRPRDTQQRCASPVRRVPEEAMKYINRLRTLVKGESGQDLLEYAMLVALIAIVCYVAVQSAGSAVFKTFNGIATQLNALPIAGGS
jgi:Flp pilus assembly pilin Flp